MPVVGFLSYTPLSGLSNEKAKENAAQKLSTSTSSDARLVKPHHRTALSSQPHTNRRLSGEKARDETPTGWPLGVSLNSPLE